MSYFGEYMGGVFGGYFGVGSGAVVVSPSSGGWSGGGFIIEVLPDDVLYGASYRVNRERARRRQDHRARGKEERLRYYREEEARRRAEQESREQANREQWQRENQYRAEQGRLRAENERLRWEKELRDIADAAAKVQAAFPPVAPVASKENKAPGLAEVFANAAVNVVVDSVNQMIIGCAVDAITGAVNKNLSRNPVDKLKTTPKLHHGRKKPRQ